MERIFSSTSEMKVQGGFETGIVLYESLQDALLRSFGYQFTDKFPLEVSGIDKMSFSVDETEFRRCFLPSYEKAYKRALENVFGQWQVPHLQASSEFVPPRKNFFGERIKDDPLNNLFWDGKQKLLEFIQEKNKFFLSDVHFELYGVPRSRLELYKIFKDERGDERGKEDISVYYLPYVSSDYFSEIRKNVQVYLNRSRSFMTCKVSAPIDKDKFGATEVLFCSVTGVDTGRTVVLNALYPEFLFIQKQMGKAQANSPDRPVLYLPKNWVANDRSLRQLGQVFGGIDIYYERFREGTKRFLEYWKFNQSLNARITTSDLGFPSLLSAASLGLASAVSSEDEASRYAYGLISGSLWAYLVWGLRRYGPASQALQQEIKARGDAFLVAIQNTLNAK